jgi:hypothetical protein
MVVVVAVGVVIGLISYQAIQRTISQHEIQNAMKVKLESNAILQVNVLVTALSTYAATHGKYPETLEPPRT